MEALPLTLCPASRSPSPTSEERVQKLAEDIRPKKVPKLYLITASLRGTLSAGPPRWSNPPVEIYEDEDLILPANEEQAEKRQAERAARRAARAERQPVESAERRIPSGGRQPARSEEVPSGVGRSPVPYTTSTPIASTSQTPAITQSSIGFSVVKPSMERSGPKGRGVPVAPSNTHSAKAPTFSSRFAATPQATPSRRPAQGSQAGSSQAAMPYNSQFDIERRVEEISLLLEEDAYEVERRAGGVSTDK